MLYVIVIFSDHSIRFFDLNIFPDYMAYCYCLQFSAIIIFTELLPYMLTHRYITDRLLMGRKESNKAKKTSNVDKLISVISLYVLYLLNP